MITSPSRKPTRKRIRRSTARNANGAQPLPAGTYDVTCLSFSISRWSSGRARHGLPWPGWVKRVGFQQMEHQQAGLALVELVDQAGEPPLADLLGGDRRAIHEGQLTAIARDQPFGLEPVEQASPRSHTTIGVRRRAGFPKPLGPWPGRGPTGPSTHQVPNREWLGGVWPSAVVSKISNQKTESGRPQPRDVHTLIDHHRGTPRIGALSTRDAEVGTH